MDGCAKGKMDCPRCKPLTNALFKLAEYEDAEEQGSLVWIIHAAWQVDKSVQETMGKDNFVCSHCRTIWASSEISNMHYCPTCGAKMDGKEEGAV